MKFFKRLFHSRDKPKDLFTGGSIFHFGRSSSGQTVNEKTAMQMSAVYACVRIIAEAIAQIPLNVYRLTADGGKEKDLRHPLFYLLHDEPNPEMTSFIFRETLMSHLLLWGNAYAQIIRNGKGEVIGLYPLMPDRMQVARNEAGNLVYTYTKYYDEVGAKHAFEQITLPAYQVLHIPGLGYDGLIGYSPIAMARNAIGMSMAAEDFGATFFANGATPGGVLEHPGIVKDPERLRESWHAQFSGKNSHNIAVLEEGMTFKPMSIPPEEAQFLETRKFQIDEIARIFRVPPHMVGDLEKSSFSNIEQQSLEFVKYTVGPWVARWEQSLSQALLLPSEKTRYTIKYNLDGLLRGDYESRMNGYAVGRQNGWLSANDIRELENMNRIPAEEGGDEYLINGNMTKLKDAGLFANKGGNESEA